ncbi:FecR domain-containing protein [Pedobacter sp. ASV1-7]|uniref:FecR family protein n=1 Tax=Pedobacter sp. ASV1-7 TaxID=3145237 RepID=UPI0032E87C90
MDKQLFNRLTDKINQGIASDIELALFNAYMNKMAVDDRDWTNDYPGGEEAINDELWTKVKPIRTSRWRFWQVAAAAMLIVTVGLGMYFLADQSPRAEESIVLRNDIDPGKQGATLTLADGKKIRLGDASSGKLAEQAGVLISKAAGGGLLYEIKDSDAGRKVRSNQSVNTVNTLSTAKGETYQLRLPDGSRVWLNAASSLTYAVSFQGRSLRTVKLQGEGYFEIAEDKAHPFIVESAGQQVEVLGTHFNINSYADEPFIKTTLLEGSVKVRSGAEEKLLKPGYQALNSGKQINITQTDVSLAIAWKNNEFVFESETLPNIMKMLERWYDVKVIYEGPVPADLFNGGVSRFDKVSEVLKVLESTKKVRFRTDGRVIYVSK